MSRETIGQRLNAARGLTSGFDYLRITAAVLIVCFHVSIVLGGESEVDAWESHRWLTAWMLPAFFIFSGFLVTASMSRRVTAIDFMVSRWVRIFPALFCVIIITTFVIGPLVTECPLHDYFTSRMTWHYLTNIVGSMKFELPGVFRRNPFVHVNSSLWTIYWEAWAYVALCVVALLGIIRKRAAVLFAFVIFLVGATIYKYTVESVQTAGAVLLTAFWSGMIFLLYRDKIVMSLGIFLVAALAVYVALVNENNDFLATVPLTYCVLYLGTLNPPRKTFLLRGDYSLATYLIHFPIAQIYVLMFPGFKVWAAAMAFTLTISLLYAHWSWYWVEKPIQGQRKVISAAVHGLWDAFRDRFKASSA